MSAAFAYFREVKHYIQTGELLPAPTLAERVEVCKKQLRKSLQWRGPESGVYAMRRHYISYLKGLPEFAVFRKRLVSANDPAEVNAVLDELIPAYAGFEFIQAPIELINYHENCSL